jgi:hypothetical protein
MTPEGKFKAKAKSRLAMIFPGCFFHEMKAGKQGIPDTLMLYKDRWALLEFKESETAQHQPNQDYYISMFSRMGYASFVYPENLESVLDELIVYFG